MPKPDTIRAQKWLWVRQLQASRRRAARRLPLLARTGDSCARRLIELYARLELPRCVGLTEAAIAVLEDAWPRNGLHETRGQWHGYRLQLDCADYFQRLSWVLRRYPDVPTQMVLLKVLRPGDTFLDGGANIGLISLFAAWRVGPSGVVHAFEPCPAPLESLRRHVRINGLSQVTIHPCGLSDRDQSCQLSLPGDDNFGAATFAPPPDRYGGHIRLRLSAPVVSADSLDLPVSGSLVIKLDIEGFELRALMGMAALMDRHRPLILTEVNEEMLQQAGASAEQLRDFLMRRGYQPFEYATTIALLRHRRLRLKPANPAALPIDVAWIPSAGPWRNRLAHWLRD